MKFNVQEKFDAVSLSSPGRPKFAAMAFRHFCLAVAFALVFVAAPAWSRGNRNTKLKQKDDEETTREQRREKQF